MRDVRFFEMGMRFQASVHRCWATASMKLGLAILAAVLLGSIYTAGGLFGSDYYRARIIRDVSDQTSPPRVVVSDPRGQEQEVIVLTHDKSGYTAGDRVVVCQPFGPPFLVPGFRGLSSFYFRSIRLPAAVIGIGLAGVGAAGLLYTRRHRIETI